MAEEINVNINVKGASDGGKKIDKLGSNIKKSTKDADNLSSSLTDAWGEVSILGTSLGSVKKAFGATALTAKKMFVSIKMGLISTGIGAFVVAIGSLLTYFAQTKDGAEILEKTLTTLGAGIKVITDRIAGFGRGIMKVFKGDFKGAAKDMTNSLKGIGKEIIEEIKLANDLADATIRIRDSQRELNVETAQRRAEVEALKLIAEDLSKDEETRLNAARQAFQIEQDLLDKRVDNAEEELRIQQERMAMGENTAEDLDKEAELLIAVANLRQESGTKQIELNNKINGIVREIAATEKASHDERMRQAAEEKKISQDKIKSSQDVLDSIRRSLLSENQLRDEDANTKRTNAENAAKTLLNETIANNNALLGEQENMTSQLIEKNQEAETIYAQQMQQILQLFYQETEAFTVTVDATRDKLLADLENMGYTLDEVSELTNEQMAELLADNADLQQQLQDSFFQSVDSIQSLVDSISQIQQTNAQENIAALDAELEAGNISQEEYEERRMEIEEESQRRQRRAAMIQILIDTAMAVAGAIKQAQAVPFPANLGAMIAGVGAVMAGIANARATLSEAGETGGGSLDSGGLDGGGGGSEEGVEDLVTSMIPSQLIENLSGADTSQPLQAYVIENDISNAQSLQEELETQATL